MSERSLNVLFLCTGNSARSIIAECILNHVGSSRFRAFSAGSFPSGTVNPLVLEFLDKQGVPTEGARSKSWDEFASPDAVKMDFVITVCDQAAGEVCPVWPGQPISAHWGVPDPAQFMDNPEEAKKVINDVFHMLNRRIHLFSSLPISSLDRLALTADERRRGTHIHKAVQDIGDEEQSRTGMSNNAASTLR